MLARAGRGRRPLGTVLQDRLCRLRKQAGTLVLDGQADQPGLLKDPQLHGPRTMQQGVLQQGD